MFRAEIKAVQPFQAWRSVWQTPEYSIWTSTSSGPGFPTGISLSSIAVFLSVSLLANVGVHTVTPGSVYMGPLRGGKRLVVCPERHVAMEL